MKVTLEISDDLYRLVEYIPEELLSKVLANHITNMLTSDVSVRFKEVPTQTYPELNGILDMLKLHLTSQEPESRIVNTVDLQSKYEAPVQVLDVSDLGDLDDFDADLLDMMK